MKGLDNLGNTCYFNSAIQCLLQVPQLSNFFITFPYVGECEFTKVYQDLVKEMWVNKNKSPVLNPQTLLDLFKKRFVHFDNFNQQDSQEVIIHILEILEKSCPIVKDIFYGELVHEIVYSGGRVKPSETFNMILLYPTEPNQTITQLMESKWSILENHSYSSGVAAIRTVYTQMPTILVVSFKMYDRKVPVQLEEEFAGKTLFAISTHHGSIYGGHYIAYTKHKGQWYIKNDALSQPLENVPLIGYHYVAMYK